MMVYCPFFNILLWIAVIISPPVRVHYYNSTAHYVAITWWLLLMLLLRIPQRRIQSQSAIAIYKSYMSAIRYECPVSSTHSPQTTRRRRRASECQRFLGGNIFSFVCALHPNKVIQFNSFSRSNEMISNPIIDRSAARDNYVKGKGDADELGSHGWKSQCDSAAAAVLCQTSEAFTSGRR